MNAAAYNSDDNYRYLRHLLLDVFGVVVGADQESYITDKLNSVMLENNIDSLQSLNEQLYSDDASKLRTEVLHAITEHTINWFNHPEINSVFSDYVLPNIKNNTAEPYRIWVVGCGNGQTVFSLAIAAEKYMKKEGRDLPIEIIATDSSEATINEAKKARFKSSFLFGIDDADRKKYMTPETDEWIVNDAIRSMVTFSVANPLHMGEEDLGKVDLIICPGMLVYYTVLVKTRVLEFVANMLHDSGILIAGTHEPVQPFCNQFVMVEHDSGTFYRKLK